MADDTTVFKTLEALYSSIHSEGCSQLDSGRSRPDPYINGPEKDKRRGITLLIPLSSEITDTLTMLENKIHEIEPELYFYSASDLHVTVLDLISVRDGFKPVGNSISKFIRLIEKAVAGTNPFPVSFKGIIASGAGILVKGFYGRGLQDLRARIREIAVAGTIGLEERYQSISAHATVARFKSPIGNWPKLRAFIEKECLREIGAMMVNEMHLVIHDWYNREKEIIGTYRLQ